MNLPLILHNTKTKKPIHSLPQKNLSIPENYWNICILSMIIVTIWMHLIKQMNNI